MTWLLIALFAGASLGVVVCACMLSSETTRRRERARRDEARRS